MTELQRRGLVLPRVLLDLCIDKGKEIVAYDLGGLISLYLPFYFSMLKPSRTRVQASIRI